MEERSIDGLVGIEAVFDDGGSGGDGGGDSGLQQSIESRAQRNTDSGSCALLVAWLP